MHLSMNYKRWFFSVILLQIIGGSFKNQAINSVSDKLLKAGELLEEVNSKRRSCLTTFTKSLELVTWLRDSIKGKVLYCTIK